MNLVLGYGVFLQPRLDQAKAALSPEEEKRILRELAKQGIQVRDPIPSKADAMSFILLAPMEVDAESMAERFFKDREYSTQGTPMLKNKSKMYRSGNEELSISPSGMVSYYRLPQGRAEALVYPDLDEDKARQAAKDFLENRLGLPESAVLDTVAYDSFNETYLVDYYRLFSQLPVFSSYLRVLITRRGVEAVWQNWLTPLGLKGPKRPIIPAAEALLRLQSVAKTRPEREEKPMVVEDVRLGYCSQIYDAERWDAPPFWRLRVSGETFYVNAFTGQLSGQIENC
ncbi:MAG: two-component system regulatory protein YycI [Firmicutes bacterium]|nr:two-component system regulatory protein YycI [Bacillota bacterium]